MTAQSYLFTLPPYTWSVAEFKSTKNVEDINILRNAKTGKCFFAYGSEKGACSKKAQTGQMTEPVVSKVYSPETDEEFIMLHQKGEGKATLLGKL